MYFYMCKCMKNESKHKLIFNLMKFESTHKLESIETLEVLQIPLNMTVTAI